MQIIYRGNEIRFTAAPLDADGNPVVPDSVSLYLNYVTASGRTTTSAMPMSIEVSGDNWSTVWDTASIGALPGIVYYTARAINPNSDEEGTFYLDALPSNPG